MNTLKNKIIIKFRWAFGTLSKAGYRHFHLLGLTLGKNGFTLALLGVLLTVRLGDVKNKTEKKPTKRLI